MRHKYIILGLSVILIMLIVAKGYEPTQFPLQFDDYDYYTSRGKRQIESKSDELIKYRISQDFSDIPWDDFSIGDDIELVNNSKNTTDSTIILNGHIIDTKVFKFFSQSNTLTEIDLQFSNASQVSNDILAMYGNKYLRIYQDTYQERYFWIKNTIVVIYERISDHGYLTIADISDYSEIELKNLINYGHIASSYPIHDPILQEFLERQRTPRDYTPHTTTKKYGDSDTYQGSSKQKEDLEAIDKYFGL